MNLGPLLVTIFSFCIIGYHLDEVYILFDKYGKSTLERSLTINPQHNRVKRSVLEDEASKKIQSNKFLLKDDKNFDLQLVWLGDESETQLLLTTVEAGVFAAMLGFKSPSKLYKSIDGGSTFININEKVGNTEIRSKMGIMKSPLNNNKLILISYVSGNMFLFALSIQKNSTLVITTDAGKNFRVIDIPFIINEGSPIIFHPSKEDWLLALDAKGGAWVSKNFGSSWNRLMGGHMVSSVKWGSAAGKEDDIYLATYKERAFFSLFQIMTSSSSLTLWKSIDGGRFFDGMQFIKCCEKLPVFYESIVTTHFMTTIFITGINSQEIVEHCYNFGIQGDFIFASISLPKSPTTQKETRVLHVSKDSGKTFHLVNVPGITADMFYAVLDMNSGMVFLHVDSEGDTGYGTLFISDADGIEYTNSLDHHFYTNSGITDFIRVTSMEGVYITQKLAQDKTLVTVITFDRGIVWQPLYVDKEKYCTKGPDICTLHLHISYSIDTKGVTAQPPLFSENAPGLILAHGQAGDALTGVSNVWLSQNGGYNWTQVGEEPHHYAIGDGGNLIVIYPQINSTGNTLKYSVDQGDSWSTYQFSNESNPIVVKGLLTEPHSQDRTFSLWGYAANTSDREWIVITISFKGIFTKNCTEASFTSWYPHSLNGKGGCFLGQKTTYRRPSPNANCFLDKDFDPVEKQEKCQCTKDDLECDFGYKRQDDGSCKRVLTIELEKVCKDGEEQQKTYSRGFRRIPGDVCEPKEAIEDLVKYIDEHKKCNKIVLADYYGIINSEREVLESVKTAQKPEERKMSIVAPLLLIGGVLIIMAMFGVWYYKKKQQVGHQATFTYIHEDNEVENSGLENNRYNPHPKGERPYTDETEGEDDVLIPL